MGKIMIVDDSVLVRRHMRSIIESDTKHTVVAEAANGHEACVNFSKLQPDLVTMDINMPIMSGIEAVETIRKEAPNAKIIMISSVNEKDLVLDALKAGATDFILKPIAVDTLIAIIRRELDATAPAPVEEKK